MPATLTQARAKLADLKAKGDSATGYADLLEDVLDLLAGPNNEFGTAATVDTGTEEGQIPLLGPDGQLPTPGIPDDLVLDTLSVREEASDANASVLPERVPNARQVERVVTWAFTPSTVLFGDPEATTGGTLVLRTGTAFAATAPVASYRRWLVRYIRPTEITVRSVDLPAALTSSEWMDVSGEGQGKLQYRHLSSEGSIIRFQHPGGPASIGQAGYRILSIQGINSQRPYPWDSVTGKPAAFPTSWDTVSGKPDLWQRDLLFFNQAVGSTSLNVQPTAAQLRRGMGIWVSGTTLATDAQLTLGIDWVGAVINRTNRSLVIRSDAVGAIRSTVTLASGRGDVITRSSSTVGAFMGLLNELIDTKAPLDSPQFTGNVRGPTPTRPSV